MNRRKRSVFYGALSAAGDAAIAGQRWANRYIALRNSASAARNALLRMKRNRANPSEVPTSNRLHGGNVVLGTKAVLTNSSRTYRFRHVGRPKDSSIQHIVWRYQGIKDYKPGDIKNRSFDLGTVTTTDGNEVTRGDSNGLFLPMYAFDLSTMAGQGGSAVTATKTGHQLQTVPMFRLRKSCTKVAGLAPTVANYKWVPCLSYQNGPDTNARGKLSPYYSPENMSTPPGYFQQVKHDWSDIQVLFQCSKSMQCKMHLALVTFDNFTGPQRQYTDTDVNEYYDSQNVQPTYITKDSAIVDNEVQSNVDLFWESFWDKKVVHPLSKYSQSKKSERIRFIKHEVVTVNKDDGTGTNDMYTHLKKWFVSGGKWTDVRTNSVQDAQNVENHGIGAFGQKPPVVNEFTGPTTDLGMNGGFGFNVIQNYRQNVTVYDSSLNARKNNIWLLIWMEAPMPNAASLLYNYNDAGTSVRKWPPTADYLDVYWDDWKTCCSFDLRVRSKFRYVVPQKAA